MERVQLLICEGTCNPHRPEVDADISRIRMRAETSGGGVPSFPTSLIEDLRSLVHTPHVQMDEGGSDGGIRSRLGRWMCTVCRTGRDY